MPLTPKDIEQKTFRASFRGYAEEEVDEFLEEVIVAIADYQQMIRERDARLADPTSGSVPRDVAGANEEANKILQAARRQADQIIDEARARALDLEAPPVGPTAVLTPDQEADRDRLLAGYERLRSELGLVRTRVQKALSASQEAFAIMEGQVETIITDAQPREPEVGEVAGEPGDEVTIDTPEGSPLIADATEDRPRRPWER